MEFKLCSYINCEDLDEKRITCEAQDAQNHGADRVYLSYFPSEEDKKEKYLEIARAVSRLIDIPFVMTFRAKRFEDVKKAFYTGAKAVVLPVSDEEKYGILKESTDRFGASCIFLLDGRAAVSADSKEMIAVTETEDCDADKVSKTALEIMQEGKTEVFQQALRIDPRKIMELKKFFKDKGLQVNTFSGTIEFSELKTGQNGLIPCIVRDCRNGDVLMMAYMNEEAYRKTIETGVMTYYSRSRNELWVKGETSGHYQYLRKLYADCDKDTLLAEVVQIGAACHTGNRSCFFETIVDHECGNKDISSVLADLYKVVCDRKVHPKEGSYTNYLFDKGIDKILKKCGEEATEMVIAAKNPSHEELKYEIADLMYHMTVLMVECGLGWEEVAAELANR